MAEKFSLEESWRTSWYLGTTVSLLPRIIVQHSIELFNIPHNCEWRYSSYWKYTMKECTEIYYFLNDKCFEYICLLFKFDLQISVERRFSFFPSFAVFFLIFISSFRISYNVIWSYTSPCLTSSHIQPHLPTCPTSYFLSCSPHQVHCVLPKYFFSVGLSPGVWSTYIGPYT